MDLTGHVDEVNRVYVTGWAVDQDNWADTLTVDILVNGLGEGVCRADVYRDDLCQLHPAATGRYAFRFYFADSLSMYSGQDVSVRVTGTTYFLAQNNRRLRAVEGDNDLSAFRPSGPVLVTTMGRTGSTAIMHLLAQHPNIVVAGGPPYEVEMGCYYAYTLRTLLAAGDHQQSLRTDNITAADNRFHSGFNPYFEASFANVFRDPLALQRFMTNRLPGRIARAFRQVILDYYEAVAIDRAIDHPIYFAEKSLPERDSRLGIRFMFPNLKEIVLVRDLRDVLCSAINSNGLGFERVLEDTAAAGSQILAILEEARPGTLLLKYEDVILDKTNTINRLFDFLGLRSVTADEQTLDRLFATHATSPTPSASVGRWSEILTQDQQNKCSIFGEYLKRIGYHA